MSTSGGRSGQPPTIANWLGGRISTSSNVSATTLFTIPAGRTWIGTCTIVTAVGVAAASTTAGLAYGALSTDQAGSPPSGIFLECHAHAGANAAGGTVGSEGNNAVSVVETIIAPAGTAMDVQYQTVVAGSALHIDISASGYLQ